MLSRSTSAEPRDNAARYLVCGRTLREDDRIRAMVALIDAADGTHIWGDSYDGSLARRLPLIDRVVAGVRHAVLPNIRNAEIDRARRKLPGDLNAHELCLRA